MQCITTILQCLGDALDLNDNFRKKQEAKELAKTLQKVYQKGKNEFYYTNIKKIVYVMRDLERSGGSLDIASLRMEEAICSDVSLLQSIIRYKEVKDIPDLKQKLMVALKIGFSTKMLQEVVGTEVDVEELTPCSQEEKCQAYIALVKKSCPICIDDFTQEDLLAKKVHRIASCHHFYHQDCIAAWAKNSPTCPVCKVEFNLIQDHEKWREYLNSIDSVVRRQFNVPDDMEISDEDTLQPEPEWMVESREVVKQFCERMRQEQASEALALELDKEDSEEVV